MVGTVIVVSTVYIFSSAGVTLHVLSRFSRCVRLLLLGSFVSFPPACCPRQLKDEFVVNISKLFTLLLPGSFVLSSCVFCHGQIEKKSFINIFKLSGFSGFDGDFSR